MTLPAVFVLAVVLGIFAWELKFGGRLPSSFRDRACQGRDWRREFPSVPKARIRVFLQIFVDAFAFNASEKLRFSPRDRIVDVYRAVYPCRWTPDSLEMEAFACELEKQFCVHLESLWSDQLTLGDLFTAIETRSA